MEEIGCGLPWGPLGSPLLRFPRRGAQSGTSGQRPGIAVGSGAARRGPFLCPLPCPYEAVSNLIGRCFGTTGEVLSPQHQVLPVSECDARTCPRAGSACGQRAFSTATQAQTPCWLLGASVGKTDSPCLGKTAHTLTDGTMLRSDRCRTDTTKRPRVMARQARCGSRGSQPERRGS